MQQQGRQGRPTGKGDMRGQWARATDEGNKQGQATANGDSDSDCEGKGNKQQVMGDSDFCIVVRYAEFFARGWPLIHPLLHCFINFC